MVRVQLFGYDGFGKKSNKSSLDILHNRKKRLILDQ